MTLDPKSDFKKFQPAAFDELRPAVQMGWFKTAVVYALADLTSRGATDQEINGANRFVELLNNLAADEVKITRLPVKSLQFLDGDQKSKEKKEA